MFSSAQKDSLDKKTKPSRNPCAHSPSQVQGYTLTVVVFLDINEFSWSFTGLNVKIYTPAILLELMVPYKGPLISHWGSSLLNSSLTWYSTNLSLDSRSVIIVCMIWNISLLCDLNIHIKIYCLRKRMVVKIEIDIVSEDSLLTHNIITYN